MQVFKRFSQVNDHSMSISDIIADYVSDFQIYDRRRYVVNLPVPATCFVNGFINGT